MRILQVNKFGYPRGGAEHYLFNLSKELTATGHQVEYFFMLHPQNLFQTYSAYFPSRLEFRTSGSLSSARRVFWNQEASRGLDRVLDDFQPDIVHLHNIRYHLSATVTKLVGNRGFPAVQTLHDYGSICPAHHLFRAGNPCERCLHYGLWAASLSRCLLGSFSRSTLAALAESWDRWGGYTRFAVTSYLCPSQFLLEKMKQGGMTKLFYLPHFVSIPSQAARGDGDYLLFLGRLDYEKGPDILLNAMKLLPGVNLKIAGTGQMDGNLHNMAKELGTSDRVEFLGQVNQNRVQELLTHASLLVFPSRVYENAPLTVYEAIASGVPVVASAPGGAMELLEGCGETFPAGDVNQLAGVIQTLLQSPQKLRDMGQRGRDKAVRKWTIEKHLSSLIEIYERAITERKRNG